MSGKKDREPSRAARLNARVSGWRLQRERAERAEAKVAVSMPSMSGWAL